MRFFRPFWFVLAYFGVVAGYGLYPVELDIGTWITVDQWHDVLVVLAGYSAIYSRHPLDNASMAALVIYVVGLALLDWLIPWAYGWAIALIGAMFIGWILYIKRRSPPLQGDETGLDKDAIYLAYGDPPNERDSGK